MRAIMSRFVAAALAVLLSQGAGAAGFARAPRLGRAPRPAIPALGGMGLPSGAIPLPAFPAAPSFAPPPQQPSPSAVAPLADAARDAARPEDAPRALGRLFDQSAPGDGAVEFLETVSGARGFPESELVRRNHAVGLYEGVKPSLRPWVAAGKGAAVGVDARGRVYQMLETPQRRLAYLLSGKREIRAVFLSARGHLVAVDRGGALLQFDWNVWRKSPLPQIARSALKIYAVGVAAGAAVVVAAQWAWLGGWLGGNPLLSVALTALGAAGSLITVGAMALNRYGRLNEETDGFVPLAGPRLGRLNGFGREEGDYLLFTEKGAFSLREALAQAGWRQDVTGRFGVEARHELLPRGRDPKSHDFFPGN